MNILLINDYGTPTGGAEILFIGLREALRAKGHDARLFTSSARSSSGVSQADYECYGTTSSFRTLLQTFNPWAYWRLRRVLAEFQPDVVHVGLFLTQLSPLILLLLRNVPSLHFAMWYRLICPLGSKLLPDGTSCRHLAGTACYQSGCLPLRDWGPLMLQRQLWMRWQHTFRLIIAHSDFVRRRLATDGILVDGVVSGAVPIRPTRPSLTGPPTVGFVGRLVREKGVDTLILAFKRVVRSIPEARLIIIGDGPLKQAISTLVHKLELEDAVVLLGQLPRLEMEETIAQAWVQAVPSHWEEPLALAALDAMMRGTAVVATNIGGMAEVLANTHAALLVPPADPPALAEALVSLLKDRELLQRMGNAGRRIAETRYEFAQFTDRFLELYAQLTTGVMDNGRFHAPHEQEAEG